jgi:succinate dehydrogenase / fumarate reductase flavoprotein subunit
MLIVSECVAKAALEREESRGGHTRDDFPTMSSKWRQINLICSLNADGSGVDLKHQPIPTIRPDLLGLFEVSELKKYFTDEELAVLGPEATAEVEAAAEPEAEAETKAEPEAETEAETEAEAEAETKPEAEAVEPEAAEADAESAKPDDQPEAAAIPGQKNGGDAAEKAAAEGRQQTAAAQAEAQAETAAEEK